MARRSTFHLLRCHSRVGIGRNSEFVTSLGERMADALRPLLRLAVTAALLTLLAIAAAAAQDNEKGRGAGG